jgi:hypothetical protein
MKLRIKGDSLRLRLSRTDVQRLIETGAVEETTHFAGGSTLRYGIALQAESMEIAVSFAAAEIRVSVPEQQAKLWAASSEQVGLYSEEVTPAVAVEKDFACIDRDDPDNADAFPNPKGAVC